ncbi:MAG: CocE/NonD family hydrolase [Actinomycetota bacterium]
MTRPGRTRFLFLIALAVALGLLAAPGVGLTGSQPKDQTGQALPATEQARQPAGALRESAAQATSPSSGSGVPVVAQASSADQYVTLADVTIPASDGVELVGDVYLPSAKGKFPAIVDMEPYGRSTKKSYIPSGYAHVNTDVRGSGKSGGALCLLCLREQRDVYDVVEWVARQSWSNGKVALTGYSYSAITALLGAALQPPHLVAVFAGHPPTDPYRDVCWQNGLFNQGFVYQWFAGQTATQGLGLGVQPQYTDRAEQIFAAEIRLAPMDGPIWWERSVLRRLDRIKVPVLMTSGWFDMYSRGDLWTIQGLQTPHRRLVMSPDTHHGRDSSYGHLGTPYADIPATPGQANEELAWFDRFVMGMNTGSDRLPHFTYFDYGSRKWKTSDTWPPSGTKTVSMRLSGATSGTANSLNDGSLTTGKLTGRDNYQDAYVYNPAAGISIPADKNGPDGFTPYAPLDQRIDDLIGLTYTSAALKKPMTLAGPIELHFWALTEADDMAWVARVIDVAPDGTPFVVTEGWLRASFRDVDPARSRPGAPYLPDDRTAPVVRGLTTEYRMDIWDTAYTVAPGHRLRIWFASSDTPNHEPLPTAGRNILFHDSDFPSEVIFTVAG